MSFAVSVSDVIARVEEHTRRQQILDEKQLKKYRAKVNKHLLRMKTPHLNIFFKYGNLDVLRYLAEELEDAGFRARVHSFDNFGAHLYIDLPYKSE